jgi:hypothetical protein
VRRRCCRFIFHKPFSATGARRHCYHRNLCAFSSSAGVLEPYYHINCPCILFPAPVPLVLGEVAALLLFTRPPLAPLVLHGIGSPRTCPCVDVYWIVIAVCNANASTQAILASCCARRGCCHRSTFPPPASLFTRLPPALFASMALAAHARAFICPSLR